MRAIIVQYFTARGNLFVYNTHRVIKTAHKYKPQAYTNEVNGVINNCVSNPGKPINSPS